MFRGNCIIRLSESTRISTSKCGNVVYAKVLMNILKSFLSPNHPISRCRPHSVRVSINSTWIGIEFRDIGNVLHPQMIRRRRRPGDWMSL